MEEIGVGKSAIVPAAALRLPFIPVTRVENFCATGTEAFRGACYAVASGAYDICLAIGVEKLKDTGYGGLPNFGSNAGTLNWQWWPNLTAPGSFAGRSCTPVTPTIPPTSATGRAPWRTGRA